MPKDEVELVKNLLQEKDYYELGNLKEEFNLFSVLDSAMGETAWSNILAFLFDSRREHGLGTAPFNAWFQAVCETQTSQAGSIPEIQKRLIDSSLVEFQAECEWTTHQGRRIDIVNLLYDINGKDIAAVVGIENKIWSDEGYEQVGDYQAALTYGFPNPPKVMVFLTPFKKPSSTQRNLKECPAIAGGYESIVRMCEQIERMEKVRLDVMLLVSSLRVYANHLLAGGTTMTIKAQELIQNLWNKNEGNRAAMKLIAKYIPTIESLEKRLREVLEPKEMQPDSEQAADRAIMFWWSQSHHRPMYELDFEVNGMNTKQTGSELIYMLYFYNSEPNIGSLVQIQIMANCRQKKSRDGTKKLKEIARRFRAHWEKSNPSHGERKEWGPWVCLWAGEKYKLKDMGDEDTKELVGLLLRAIENTYDSLVQTPWFK